MKRVLALVLIISLLAVTIPVQASHECEDRWYLADDGVVWCAHEGWTLWTALEHDTDDLEDILAEIYDWTFEDLYGMGRLPLRAIQIHPAHENFAVYGQLFEMELPSDFSTPQDFIQSLMLSSTSGEIRFETRHLDGRVIGFASNDYDSGGSRKWVVYPFADLGKAYVVAAYAPRSVWESSARLKEELDDVLYTLNLNLQPTQSSSGSSSSGKRNTQVYEVTGILDVDYARRTVIDSWSPAPQTFEYDEYRGLFEGAVLEVRANGTIELIPGSNHNVADVYFPLIGSYSMNGTSVVADGSNFSITGGTISFQITKRVDYPNTGYALMQIQGTIDNERGVADVYGMSSLVTAYTSIAGARSGSNTAEYHISLRLR